jgi:hypothetical protein
MREAPNPGGMQGDEETVGRDVDPLDQEPQDTRLLGRVEFVPNRLERAERVDHLALFQHGMIRPTILPAHRGDGPRDQLGGCEQPPDLADHEALHLARRDRAHPPAICRRRMSVGIIARAPLLGVARLCNRANRDRTYYR